MVLYSSYVMLQKTLWQDGMVLLTWKVYRWHTLVEHAEASISQTL